jgi:hypothetical protein
MPTTIKECNVTPMKMVNTLDSQIAAPYFVIAFPDGTVVVNHIYDNNVAAPLISPTGSNARKNRLFRGLPAIRVRGSFFAPDTVVNICHRDARGDFYCYRLVNGMDNQRFQLLEQHSVPLSFGAAHIPTDMSPGDWRFSASVGVRRNTSAIVTAAPRLSTLIDLVEPVDTVHIDLTDLPDDPSSDVSEDELRSSTETVEIDSPSDDEWLLSYDMSPYASDDELETESVATPQVGMHRRLRRTARMSIRRSYVYAPEPERVVATRDRVVHPPAWLKDYDCNRSTSTY